MAEPELEPWSNRKLQRLLHRHFLSSRNVKGLTQAPKITCRGRPWLSRCYRGLILASWLHCRPSDHTCRLAGTLRNSTVSEMTNETLDYFSMDQLRAIDMSCGQGESPCRTAQNRYCRWSRVHTIAQIEERDTWFILYKLEQTQNCP